MIQDRLVTFCDATSCAGAAGTALLGSQVDLGSIGVDLGAGERIFLVVQTTTEVITGGVAGTIVFQLVSDDTAAIATNGTATVHLTSATLVTDDSAANSAALNVGGYIMRVALPIDTYERFVGIIATIGTTTVTAGAIDAYLVKDVPLQRAYPDAI